MDGDRLMAAFERHILHPQHEDIRSRRDHPEGMTIETNWGSYYFRTQDWLIAQEAWVADAVRVVLSSYSECVPAPTYGLIVPTEGEVVPINSTAAAHELGRRLGESLDPLAYAELLAEFYSVPDIEGPVVDAVAVSEFTKSGWLVRDVDQILAEFPFLDPATLYPPAVRQSADRVEMSFTSCHYHQAFLGSADVLEWTVSGSPDGDVRWQRGYAARCVSRPAVVFRAR
ncbi:hypothetical protein O7627_20520 [Solwaraspora sp. WMMD1047]|uniref:hypothetical protein n=1 Tax=Solwaraspora sp. WMMD1047 TaxID=3016102 RepID=UPI002417B7BA|nr:hypothetical protein [Solwaraspora sp. WMMD1047]MDG4831669.1 hypothetical protein [Solwaraspora sp. WMMD1047]